MKISDAILLTTGGVASAVTIEDVFSTYVETSPGAAHDVVIDIDLDQYGGMVWSKRRSSADNHVSISNESGSLSRLSSNITGGSGSATDYINSFNSDGFTAGSNFNLNDTNVFWSFRKAPRFFDVQTVTKAAGVDKTVDLSDLETLGMVMVKRTDDAGSWYVWHRSLTAGKLLYLEQTAVEATLGQITVSGTTVTLEDGVIADGDYIVYGYAHDPLGPSGDGSDGLIACGSFEGNVDVVDLGWEPQYVMMKNADDRDNWVIYDTMRGFTASGSDDYLLWPNAANAEARADFINTTSTGFDPRVGSTAGHTFIYMAIRRPNKPAESATEVFAIQKDAVAPGLVTSNFPVDIAISRDLPAGQNYITARITGGNYFGTSSTDAEGTNIAYWQYDQNEGIYHQSILTTGSNIWYMFKRATGFFDVVAYDGDSVAGREIYHNLTIPAEMFWLKRRNGAGKWAVYHSGMGADKWILLESDGAIRSSTTIWDNKAPTASVFTVDADAERNATGGTYIAYLFATLAGISKVGSFSHTNGAPTNVDCGFSAGSRMVIAKRTDDTGSWFLWDSERGIVSGDSPYLLLNTSDAQVTNTDYIDPLAAGFTIAADFATGSYIFYAIA